MYNDTFSGMSTVHEVVTARHSGLKCLAFSLITNICATSSLASDGHNVENEVFNVAEESEQLLKDFVSHLIKTLADNL